MQKVLEAADEKPPVIVFTCGRSGSTLLIRMLNCLPATIVWGEHNGALKPLLNSYSRLRDVAGNRFVSKAAELLQPVYDRQPILSNGGMSVEWLNWFNAADIDRLYRDLIRGIFYPDSARHKFSRWGFKEIQYREFECTMLAKLFPGMKTIILYRNPVAVFASQFKNFAKNDGERLPKILSNIEGYFRFAAMQAERRHALDGPPLFISYEEIVGDFDRSLLSLQAFLEEEFASSIEEIGNDITRFRKRWKTGNSSDNLIKDFETWGQAADATLPPQKIQLIADYYETVVKATAMQAEITRAQSNS